MKCSKCDVELIPKKEMITVEIPDKVKGVIKFKHYCVCGGVIGKMPNGDYICIDCKQVTKKERRRK